MNKNELIEEGITIAENIIWMVYTDTRAALYSEYCANDKKISDEYRYSRNDEERWFRKHENRMEFCIALGSIYSMAEEMVSKLVEEENTYRNRSENE